MRFQRGLALLALIVGAIFSRFLPHPPNFTAVGAAAVFAGVMLPGRWLSLVVPLAAMVVSDAVLGFHALVPAVYLAMCLGTALGWQLDRERPLWTFAGVGALSSVQFYVVTNFAVWVQTDMYPKNAAGLLSCYVAGIPFLEHMLCGDVVFILLLVGALRLAERGWPALRVSQDFAASVRYGSL